MNGETLGPYYQPYQPYNPFAGLPGGMPAQLAGQWAGGFAQKQGYLPVGFNYGGDLYNLIERQHQEQQHLAALARAQATDAGIYGRTIQGASEAFGFDKDPKRQAAFTSMATSVLGTGLYDQLSPRQQDILSGGMTLTGLVSRIDDAGRTAIDPITGRRGYTSDTSAEISRNIHNRFFSSPAARMQVSGMSSGDVGDLFGELQNRGMIPGGPGGSDGSGVMLSTKTRGDLAKRMGDQIKDYSAAVTAVKELFGTPDAPMQQLLSQLEQLTGNSLQQIGGARATAVVRNMMNYAQDANVGIEGLTYMAQYSGELANRQGLNSAFMPGITMAGLAMRDYMDTSGSLTDAAWGLSSIEQQGRIAQQRMAGAIGSDTSNRAGLLMRLNKQGLLTGSAAEMARKLGNKVFDDRLRTMSDGEFAQMVVSNSEGTSVGQVNSMLRQTEMNAEFVNTYGIGTLVANSGQRADLRQYILGGSAQSSMTQEAYKRVREKMGKGHDGLARTLADVAGNAFANMSQADRANDDTRYGGMAEAMYAKIHGTAEGDAYLQKLGKDKDAQLRALGGIASSLYGRGDADVREAYGVSLIDLATQTQPKSAAELARAEARVSTKSLIQTLMSGAYDPHAARRMFAAFQKESGESGPGAGMRLLTGALGLPSAEEVQKLIMPQLQEMADMYDKAMADKNLSPEEKEQLEIKRQALQEHRSRVMEILKASGIDPESKDGEGDAVSSTASSASADSGGAGPIAMTGTITINIEGQPVATGTKGTIAVNGTSRGAAPNAGAIV